MTAAINLNSYSYLLRLGILERIKVIPPFNGCAKIASTPARPIQAEHLPYFGSYFLKDELSGDGDENHAEPRFVNRLHVGYSYIIQNNNDEEAAEKLDLAYWSFMKLLHDPAWHLVTLPSGDVIRLESITNITRDENLKGNMQGNETPVAELTVEVTYLYRIGFEPIVDDAFEALHMTIPPAPDKTDPDAVQQITVLLNLPQ